MKRFFAFASLLALFSLLTLPLSDAQAQNIRPRFGTGFNLLLSPSDGVGLGFRGRIATPVNQDLSLAVDLGFSGFIFGGRDDANYVFAPQLSSIITFPGRSDRAPYLLAGIGAYALISQGSDFDGEEGPTLHFGLGWVRTLAETTLFYEVNPALIIGDDVVDVIFPLRIGIIF